MSRVSSRFMKSMKAIDRVLVRFLAVTLSLLFVAQALLLSPSTRRALNLVEQFEGESIQVARQVSPEPAPSNPVGKGVLTVTCENGKYGPAILLVNGQETGSFGEKSVSAEVRSGDLIEIDGGTRPVKIVFSVTGVTSGIENPRVGQTIETKGSIEIVGRVRIR